ncbi:uncharacterized protein [Argopecten irradians]|uniref:uncharacterized protein n=1 Tax=Argopecten irradians TaxID=31199 RepID=UPI003713229F
MPETEPSHQAATDVHTEELLKKKEMENAYVVACIHLELENGGRMVEAKKKNHHVLEEGNSCVIINVIQEADESAAETTAEHTSRFQPLVITKQGGELVNAWIENYQDVLGKSVAVLSYSTNRSDDELQNLFNHGFGGTTRQTRNIRGSSQILHIDLQFESEIEPSPQIATSIRTRKPQKKSLPSWMPETEPSHQAETDIHTEELLKKKEMENAYVVACIHLELENGGSHG